MSGPEIEVERERRLLPARIAGQAGLVTRQQAIAAGHSRNWIRWQVTSGRWTQLHRGVYLTTPGRDDWEMHAVASLLAVGPPCVLAGSSAGAAWGLASRDVNRFTIVVPYSRRGLSRPKISVVRSRAFSERAHETEWPHRTSAEHTIFDLALEHGPDRVIALMAKGCQLRIVTETSLAAALVQRRGQPHRDIIREALGLVGDGAESAAEVRHIRDVERAHGLPIGLRQEPAPGSRKRDSSYAEVRVIVEIDGRLGHEGWVARQKEGKRDRKAATDGWLTVRGGWTDVAVEPCDFASDLDSIFRSRGWPGQATACDRPTCAVRRLAA